MVEREIHAPHDCAKSAPAPEPPHALQDQLFDLMRHGAKQTDVVSRAPDGGSWISATKTVQGPEGNVLQATLKPDKANPQNAEIFSIFDTKTGQEDYYKGGGSGAPMKLTDLSDPQKTAIQLNEQFTPQTRVISRFDFKENDEMGKGIAVARFDQNSGMMSYESGWRSRVADAYRATSFVYTFDRAGKAVTCPPNVTEFLNHDRVAD